MWWTIAGIVLINVIWYARHRGTGSADDALERDHKAPET